MLDMPSLLSSKEPLAEGITITSIKGSKGTVAVFDNMNAPVAFKAVKKRDRSLSISSIGNKAISSSVIESESKSDDKEIATVDGSVAGEKKEENPKSTPSSTTLKNLDAKGKVSNETVGGEKEGLDSLDDYMSSLYGDGEVEEQRGMPLEQKVQHQNKERRGNGVKAVSTASISPRAIEGNLGVSTNGVSDLGPDGADGMDLQSSPVADTNNEEDYPSLVDENDVGSNFITLDQIMGSKSPSRASSSSSGRRMDYSSRVDYSNSGWESDSAPPSPLQNGYGDGDNTDRDGETDEEREDREDRERKEFIDAIRAARAAEDLVREKIKQKDEAAEKAKEQLGRVFAGEGDVEDETDLEEKKKSALEILEVCFLTFTKYIK
jgi:hypothetical protein